MNIDEQIERQIRKEKVMGAGSKPHELLEHAGNGNFYTHGTYASAAEAHKDAKSLGLRKYSVAESKDPIYADSKKNKGGKC